MDNYNSLEDLNSTSSDEILFALAQNLGGMANAIFPKLDCGYFSDEENIYLGVQYRKIARMQKNIINHLNNRGVL
tara:strand:+ start:353 stop:577 length:225 start_codon:yes stop_codon:yes gene_type:complete